MKKLGTKLNSKNIIDFFENNKNLQRKGETLWLKKIILNFFILKD